MNPALLFVVVAAMLMVAAAIWLFARAQVQERQDGLKLRLQVVGTDEAAGGTLLREIRNPVVRSICRLLWRSGSEVAPSSVGRAILFVVVLFVVVALVTGPVVSTAIFGFLLLVVYMVLIQRASRRRLKTIDQLPGFLDNVIRVLAAGNTFEESLVQAARESPDPIRPLFGSIGRQVRLGAPLEQVLMEAGNIHKIRDLNVIGLAASINRKYGGSMRSVLKSLIVAIRQRGAAAKELRALTAETRFSAFVLAFITVGLIVYLVLSNRKYYDAMLATTGGFIALVGAGSMVLAGFFVLWRMLKSIDEAD